MPTIETVAPPVWDVCIVGARVAALTAAPLLGRVGSDVLVLEQHAIGGGESQHTTVELMTALDRA